MVGKYMNFWRLRKKETEVVCNVNHALSGVLG